MNKDFEKNLSALAKAVVMATATSKSPENRAKLLQTLASVSGRTITIVCYGDSDVTNTMVDEFSHHLMESATEFAPVARRLATSMKCAWRDNG